MFIAITDQDNVRYLINSDRIHSFSDCDGKCTIFFEDGSSVDCMESFEDFLSILSRSAKLLSV